ncbi:MAG: class I SAM-dependent methyltransferase [Geobacteraceae bacterium]|nr:class I SAM-dependent methyltransferase [Geobacteraceae bacterium]
MNLQGLYGAVPLAHYFFRERLKAGDRVVDATCGNGLDTLLLAELVGINGRVWAFDVQADAIETTRALLAEKGYAEWVTLVHGGHELMAETVDEEVMAVVFNLGYLPTGDREVKTSAATTVAALDAARSLLLPNGLILIAVYTGHDGGGDEWLAVKEWCERLNPHQFNVWQSRQLNRSERAPFLVVVEKVAPTPSLSEKHR